MNDFFGKDGIFAKLFAHTPEQMKEEELPDHLGNKKRYEVKGCKPFVADLKMLYETTTREQGQPWPRLAKHLAG